MHACRCWLASLTHTLTCHGIARNWVFSTKIANTRTHQMSANYICGSRFTWWRPLMNRDEMKMTTNKLNIFQRNGMCVRLADSRPWNSLIHPSALTPLSAAMIHFEFGTVFPFFGCESMRPYNAHMPERRTEDRIAGFIRTFWQIRFNLLSRIWCFTAVAAAAAATD